MSDDGIERRVVEIASDIFDRPADDLTVEATPADVDSWDSVAQLNLMMALEDEFSIAFYPSDVDLMASLGAVAELVRRRST